MPVTVVGVGHAVLKVRDLNRSTWFYTAVLGLHEVARRDFGEGPMVFLSTGNSHHDLALVQPAFGASETANASIGLHHLALLIGDDLHALRKAKDHLEAHDIEIHMMLDHRVSQGIYISDPDGYLLELYVDAETTLWRDSPALVANSEPLTL